MYFDLKENRSVNVRTCTYAYSTCLSVAALKDHLFFTRRRMNVTFPYRPFIELNTQVPG